MIAIPGYDIRYSTLRDGDYLRQWLQQPEMLHWFPMSDEKEAEHALQCWMGYCRYSSSLTCTIDQIPCAIGTLFLMPYRKVAHHCLFKIIVDPKYQRKGIGSSLLKNLQHLGKTYFSLENMYSEIFEGNPIEKIFHKAGFYLIVRQEEFVKEGDKFLARLLYQCDLK